jgi:hypothetical protein
MRWSGTRIITSSTAKAAIQASVGPTAVRVDTRPRTTSQPSGVVLCVLMTCSIVCRTFSRRTCWFSSTDVAGWCAVEAMGTVGKKEGCASGAASSTCGRV